MKIPIEIFGQMVVFRGFVARFSYRFVLIVHNCYEHYLVYPAIPSPSLFTLILIFLFSCVCLDGQSTWLSYGGAHRHPCILPQLSENIWDSAGDGCAAIQERGEKEAIWEVGG